MNDIKTKLYDVLMVNTITGNIRAIAGESKTIENAEAIVKMAIIRRGVGEEFYPIVNAGSLKVGDIFDGAGV